MASHSPHALTFQTFLHGVTPDHLQGFFEGWPHPPRPDTHLKILRGSQARALARLPGGQVVGFVTALSDGVLSAYLPLLEVLPEWRGQGVASRLVELVITALGDLYMIDSACDDELVPFYERLGMVRGNAMIRRKDSRQNGR
ncbi:GNAT family N-acetyltransferase [Deinococcus koreensis]|uniref:GNAT family N-acetyltransferase n=1 Tax=Deinococcus koreensis TaxID=2054903 RepID=A0A2K3UU03_9DEIO|nr:GNAT family N-acetyltransferase [Deinococcus koreensis]PNY80024.1 GNAT family N-acetyltransferase [Deinococcus koreensis]